MEYAKAYDLSVDIYKILDMIMFYQYENVKAYDSSVDVDIVLDMIIFYQYENIAPVFSLKTLLAHCLLS